MLSSPEIIEVVARQAQKWRLRLVVDPVMVAKGGACLLRQEAVETLQTRLLPLAELVTPNLPEAEVLTNKQGIESIEDMRAAARIIYELGPQHVVIKGGHRTAEPVDVYFDGMQFHELWAERIETIHTHGTGCTFSAAITALLARGWPVKDAVIRAKRYVTGAIRNALGLGHGYGPIDHFWLWDLSQSEHYPSNRTESEV
jgi:hydroxymethylpyrimidine/phosphomethylpyrimidine kinase